MFIFCSWPVWYNVYNTYLSWHYSYQFQWRVMTFFCKKIWFTFHFSFFLNTCSMFAREYWVFPYLVLFYVHWTFIMNENLSQNIVLFIFVCTARILLFLLLFIYWKWRIKFVFYLHWLSCVLLLYLRFWHSWHSQAFKISTQFKNVPASSP